MARLHQSHRVEVSPIDKGDGNWEVEVYGEGGEEFWSGEVETLRGAGSLEVETNSADGSFIVRVRGRTVNITDGEVSF